MSDLVHGERPDLTGWEKALRLLAAALALVSVGFAVIYIVQAFAGDAEYPYVVNSVAKDGLLAGLALLVLWDVRRWAAVAVPLIIAGHLLLIAMLTATHWANATGTGHTWVAVGPITAPSSMRVVWIGADVVVVLLFVVLHHMAIRSRYDLRYLPPAAFRSLMAVAEVLFGREDREVAPAEVAGRVDHYLAGFMAKDKRLIRLALIVLAYAPLFPPLHFRSVEAREKWLRRRFLDVAERRVPGFIRDYEQGIIHAAQQFCYMGYYGDERAAARAGYVPFSRRPGYDAAMEHVDGDRRGVTCITPDDVEGDESEFLIVGTGAGGAMLAYELAARGRRVLMLERGSHVRPQDFSENEAEQLSKLYRDGAMTLSRDMRFQVAQGMCVGGSTVVNNAVCFNLPERVLERWQNEEGLNAGLDERRLRDAFAHVRDFLQVGHVNPERVLNPGAREMIANLGPDAPWRFEVVECNVDGCLGCGYCNIGCAYGKKLSALDHTLPKAQALRRGEVRILPDCRVERVLMRGATAYGVQARVGDRPLTLRAKTVVLSAGAIASSVILQRSGIGERAGERVAFNMASPMTLDFHPRELHSERGLQISHYLEPVGAKHDGIALESWFNPIVSQSLFMPGWFKEHWENMRHYASMTCLGVVVGTKSDTRVRATRSGGVDLPFKPDPEDFQRLKDGLVLAGRIGLKSGAPRVLPASFRMIDICCERALSRIETEIKDDSDLAVNSAHPQGGNPISVDARKGVVDPDFRVYGTMNVHVCDASVFPSSITVNPQLTVMALAAYAAECLAGPRPPAPPGAVAIPA
jgi:choline dehydrogenase-like flavoprotein